MKKDLNYFLFKKEVLQEDGNRKSSFFRFQNDLAKAIVESPGPYSDKDVKSVRPYLNQVLKPGGASYEKPMSENLKKQILKILKERLFKEDPLYENLEDEFSKAYKLLKAPKTKEQDAIIVNDYEEFVSWSLKANKLVVLLNEPGEIFWKPNSDTKNDIDFLLNRLFEIIFKNFEGSEDDIIRILKDNKTSLTRVSTSFNSFSHKFYFPSYAVGLNFWKSLLHFFYKEKLSDSDLKKEDKIRIALNFFKLINGSNSQKNNSGDALINIYKIAPYLTLIPLVLFQSTEDIKTLNTITPKEEIFVLSLNKGILKNVERLPDKSKMIWKEHVYFDLKNANSSNKFGVEEISFSDYITDIISLLDTDITI